MFFSCTQLTNHCLSLSHQERLSPRGGAAPPPPALLSALFAFIARAVDAGDLVTDALLQAATASFARAMPSLVLKVGAGAGREVVVGAAERRRATVPADDYSVVSLIHLMP